VQVICPDVRWFLPARERPMNLIWAGLLAVTLMSLGCDRAASDRSHGATEGAHQERQEPIGRWAGEQAWRLSARPVLSIAPTGEGSAPALHRVVGAVRLRSGGIAIANGGSNQLLRFHDDGTFIASVGRSGDGPGEFGALAGLIQYRGDSLALFDASGSRISILASDGSLGRTIPIRLSALPEVVGTFADGSFLVRNDPITIRSAIWRDTAAYVRVAPSGEGGDTLGLFPTQERFLIDVDGRPIPGNRPFGRRTQSAVDSAAFWIGTAGSFEVTRHGLDGSRRRVVLPGDRPASLSRHAIEVHEREQLEAAEGTPAYPMVERVIDSGRIPYPETVPPYGRMNVDPDGNLWVRDASVPCASRWTVFDRQGSLLGTVEAPCGFTAFQVGRRHMIGVQRDDLDVESVQVYEVFRYE
jgi:hypothetical protein